MLSFERTAKGFHLTGRPCVFGIFVKPKKVSIAGFTDDLSPEDVGEVCTVLRRAAREAAGRNHDDILGSREA